MVLSEVIEHLNPYYVNHTLYEVNRILKVGGKLVITTPNIASLFRRIRLLLGIQPQYRFHVHEYTKKEIEALLLANNFSIIKSFYSDICDLTQLTAPEREKHLKIKNYYVLLKKASRNPAKTNIMRALAYPIIKLFPSLRMLIVILAEKRKKYRAKKLVERWG